MLRKRRRRPIWDGFLCPFLDACPKILILMLCVGNPSIDFPTQLRLIRVLLNLRQKGMADLLGVKADTLSAWETGWREPGKTMQRMTIILAEREGVILNDRGYPEYAQRQGSQSPTVE